MDFNQQLRAILATNNQRQQPPQPPQPPQQQVAMPPAGLLPQQMIQTMPAALTQQQLQIQAQAQAIGSAIPPEISTLPNPFQLTYLKYAKNLTPDSKTKLIDALVKLNNKQIDTNSFKIILNSIFKSQQPNAAQAQPQPQPQQQQPQQQPQPSVSQDEARNLILQYRNLATDEERRAFTNKNPVLITILQRSRAAQTQQAQQQQAVNASPIQQTPPNQGLISPGQQTPLHPRNMPPKPSTPQTPVQQKPNARPASVMMPSPMQQPSAKKQKLGPDGKPLPGQRGRPPQGEKNEDVSELSDVAKIAGVNLEKEDEDILNEEFLDQEQYTITPDNSAPFLNKEPLRNKLAIRLRNAGLKTVNDAVLDYLTLAVQERVRTVLEELVELAIYRQQVNLLKFSDCLTQGNNANHDLLQREKQKKAKIEADRARKEAERDAATREKESFDAAENEKKKKKAAMLEKKKQLEDEDRRNQREAVNSAAEGLLGNIRLKSRPQPQHRPLPPGVATPNASPQQLTAMAAAQAAAQQQLQKPAASAPKPTKKRAITVNDVLALIDRQPELKKSHRIYNAAQNALSNSK